MTCMASIESITLLNDTIFSELLQESSTLVVKEELEEGLTKVGRWAKEIVERNCSFHCMNDF